MNYLRISVTDRCNLRCSYCMPSEKMDFLPKSSILSYEELLELIQLFSEIGVDKIRFTGGEPFIRRDFIDLLRETSKLSSLKELHLTTNALLIEPYIEELASLNLAGINISLDTLQEARFKNMTKRGGLPKLLTNIHQLIESKIPIKINMVVQNGENEDELIDMIEYFKTHPIELRFIEHMPFNGAAAFQHSILHEDMEAQLRAYFKSDIENIPSKKESTAKRFRIKNSPLKLGIIAGFSRLFCAGCNRMRISSNGNFQSCLYGEPLFNLKDLLRTETKQSISKRIQFAITKRYADGFAAEQAKQDKHFESMSKIGG